MSKSLEEDVAQMLSGHNPAMAVVFTASSRPGGNAGLDMGLFIRARKPDIRIVIVGDGDPEEEPLTDDFKWVGSGKAGFERLSDEILNIYDKNSRRKTPRVFSKAKTYGELCLVSPWQLNDSEDLAELLDNRIAGGKVKGVVFLTPQGTERYEKSLMDLLSPWLAGKPKEVIFCIQAPVSRDADLSFIETNLPFLFERGLRMIVWQVNDKGLPRQLLWQVSKQGIWNHVSGKGLFSPVKEAESADQGVWIANNPNIVHSFEDLGRQGGESAVSRACRAPEELLAYRKVRPLPDIPFWQILPDPFLILGFLSRISQRELIRHRVNPDRPLISILGSGISFNFKQPKEVPADILDEITAMVEAGGSVDITHVRANLEKAYLIGYALENGVVIGNSSLKHPRQVFIDRLKGITGLDFTNFVERGYTSVRPEYRAMGVGAKLLEGLTARADDVKVFSLISEDNLATQKIAIRNNTRKIATYFSDKVGKEMGIWMPVHMIDDEWELKI
ncbi:MAG: hypothetical protein MI863_16600 [Desulfobacterales bacterium]|nr:hypothetical protein [Desulfobacterales bacterium]